MTTISKVAERAGVSRTTVSHVLNHADRVSEHLRARVLEAIEELGYSPNPQAQSLRTGRTNIVALLIPDIRNPFYTELVRAAQTDLEAIGLDTMIFNSDVPGGHPQDHNREYLRQIRNKRVDGLIVGDFALHRMHDELRKLDMPAVFIGDLPNHAVDSVKIDDFGGGEAMGRYLATNGHRRIAHVTGPGHFAEAMARAAGFEKGMADNGAPVPPELRYEGTYLPPSGEQAGWGDLPALAQATGRAGTGAFCGHATFPLFTGEVLRRYGARLCVGQSVEIAEVYIEAREGVCHCRSVQSGQYQADGESPRSDRYWRGQNRIHARAPG